jgi:tetratricopeptide (TPR) repeat protein
MQEGGRIQATPGFRSIKEPSEMLSQVKAKSRPMRKNQRRDARAAVVAVQARQSVAALNAKGNALLAAGEFGAAEASYLQAIAQDPEYADAHFNLGNLHRRVGKFGQALEDYTRVLALETPQADLYNNLGTVYSALGKRAEAKRAFGQALELNLDYAMAWFNLGSECAKCRQHVEAIECLERALGLQPDYAKAHHNLGTSHQKLGELAQATRAYREALRLNPREPGVRMNLAVTLILQGETEGLAYFEEVIAETPDSVEAHWNSSAAFLLLGQYERGFREYEWRWRWSGFTSPHRDFAQPQWQGEELAGAPILLHAEQGFGDTLQFVRYAPMVAERGGRVLLEVHPALKRLVQGLPGVAECIAQGEPLPEFTRHLPLMSLPMVFGTAVETVPAIAPFAWSFAQGPSSEAGGTPRSGGVRVGLVWAGSPTHVGDRLRSLALSEFLPLRGVERVCFVSLQKGDAAAQGRGPESVFELPEPCARAKDFAETAEILAGLDLVISVDTAVAHLAGSMGKPVWILLSQVPEWRWGLSAETTPWYPTARLFRKAGSEPWSAVMQRVGAALEQFVAEHEPQDLD